MKCLIIFALTIIASAATDISKIIPATIFGDDQYAFKEFLNGAFMKMLDKEEIKLPRNVSLELQSSIDKALVSAYNYYFEYLHEEAYQQIDYIFWNFTDFLKSCESCEAKSIPEIDKLNRLADPYISLINHLEIEDAIVDSLSFVPFKKFNKSGSKFGQIFSILKPTNRDKTYDFDSMQFLKEILGEVSQTSVGSCINAVSEITTSATQLLSDGLDVINGNIFALAKLYVSYDQIQKSIIEIQANCNLESLSDIEVLFSNINTQSIFNNLYLNKDIIEADLKGLLESEAKNLNYGKAFVKIIKILLNSNTNQDKDAKNLAAEELKKPENLACLSDVLKHLGGDWKPYIETAYKFRSEAAEEFINYSDEIYEISRDCGVPGFALSFFSLMD
ncbi:unnamed protein product [Blepharisma stoltei]|uniref:Uncharacterized protein n=1 Tax=Blepharisma stoltei TaxID=1481888 RepID=A0AAU9JRD6_9CILI|nr:unnamed protein product [Blepharisma stoltei]